MSPRRLLARLALALLAPACQPADPLPGGAQTEEPSSPREYELRDVVGPEIARLEAELAKQAADPRERAHPDRILGLLSLLAGRDGRMRAVAVEEAEGLQESCEAQLGELLLDQEEEQGLRQAAAEMLALVGGDQAAELLLGALESSEEAWLRTQAAWRLGELELDWVIPRMVLRFKYEKDFETVIWMARSLASLGNYEGLMALQQVADGAQDQALIDSAYGRMLGIAQAADYADVESLWAAWTAGPPFPPMPEGMPAERSTRYQLEVWRLMQRFVEFQLRGVDDSRFVLQRLDGQAAAAMGRALRDESAYIRVGVAQSLQRMGPRAAPAGEALVQGLGDPDLGPWAALALGAIGPSAYPLGQAALVQRLESSSDPELRLSCLRGLAGFGLASEPASRLALRRVLESAPAAAEAGRQEPEEFRQAACESLLAHGETEGVVERLLEWMVSKRVSPVSSQRALRSWLETRSEEPPVADLIQAWDALRLPDQQVVSSERRAQVKRDQAALLRAALPTLLPSSASQDS